MGPMEDLDELDLDPDPFGQFARWFTGFLPRVDLEPTLVSDVTDGKAYHLAGLNLSRAWMLEGIVSRLPFSR